MQLRPIIILVLVPLVVLFIPEAGLAEDTWFGEDKAGEWFKNHVEIGTRITHFDLDDDSSDSFLGTINKLNDKQNHAPFKVFANVLVNPYVGIELAYDELEASTETSSGKSDGTLTMSGPIVSLFARYPNESQFTPYAGIGWAIYSSDFDEAGHWKYGYSDPQSYEAAGSPKEPSGGRLRKMSVDDDTGLVLYGGVIWTFAESWSAEAFIRTMDLDADAEFTSTVYGKPETQKSGSFPMSNTSYGIGIRYLF